MKIIEHIKFGSDQTSNDLLYLNPKVLIMLAEVNLYAHLNKIPFVITSIYRSPNDGISKSSTHQTWRAVDISVRGWDTKNIDDIYLIINQKYSDIGAISASTKKRRPIVVHDSGHGYHIHLQCDRS